MGNAIPPSDVAEQQRRVESHDGPNGGLPVFSIALQFIRRKWMTLLAVSAVVLTPCFWQRRIQAGDLGSHTYNAWLGQLIHQGNAPGLRIVPQWTNILFDWMLSGLGSIFGLAVAEKLAVSAAILIFFWGAFVMVCAVARRASWSLLPLIATVAYGWTFHAGFFNYYIAMGLSFFALAISWRGSARERLIAFAFLPLIWLAHPLGVFWLLGAVAYIFVAERVPVRLHLFLLSVAAAAMLVVRVYLTRHFITDGTRTPLHQITGADQFFLFGIRYFYLALALSLLVLAAYGADVLHRRHEPGYWGNLSIPTQLYAVVEMGVFLLPASIYLPTYGTAIGFVMERLSSVSAVLVCCILAAIQPRKWHVAGFAVFAVVFFAFVYQDEAVLNRMEQQVERLVGDLPQGSRVMETILAPHGSRVYFINHMVDRACIGRCFAYGNYEPASLQFRIRARPGNGIAVSLSDDLEPIENGYYVVRPEDLPAYQVYQCSANFTDLCIRKLEAGEKNDRLGVHPHR